MEQRNSLVVILLAAILGSAAIAPRSSGTAYTKESAGFSQSETVSATDPTAFSNEHSAKAMLTKFFLGMLELERELGSDDAYALVDAVSLGHLQLPEEPTSAYWSVDSLIATVPDPIESGLGGQFDNFTDAIQRAMIADGFVLDRFDNLWPLSNSPSAEHPDGKPPTETDSTRAADGKDKFTERRKNRLGEKTKERKTADVIRQEDQPSDEAAKIELADDERPYVRNPSILLFRRNYDRHLLVVFLVGENPTRGIHKFAFASALTQAVQLPDIGNDTSLAPPQAGYCKQSVKILGPSFSGSAFSMEFAIRQWMQELHPVCTPWFHVISGSATAIKPKGFLPGLGDFHATVIPYTFTTDTLLSWLKRWDGDHVALLSEEDTLFGTRMISRNSGDTWTTTFGNKTLRLSFPLHIAELQKRAAERAQLDAKTGSQTELSLGNPDLPLGFDESHSRQDIFPLYSASETNSIELVLDGVLRTIAERRIDYVIIGATDTEDTIYLARKIRELCPNVTPIALNGDVMYLHSSVNRDLRGMLVASTYPLYPENQRWTRPQQDWTSVVQFPTDGAEGVYNATLALLNEPDLMLDYGQPFDPNTNVPPLWISIVGGDQFWPLTIRSVKKDTAAYSYLFTSTNDRSNGWIHTFKSDDVLPQTTVAANIPTSLLFAQDVSPNDPGFKLYPSPFLALCLTIGLGAFFVWCLLAVAADAPAQGFFFRLRNAMPLAIQQIFSDSVVPRYAHVRRAYLLFASGILFGLIGTVAYYFFLPLRTGPEIAKFVDPLVPPFWAAQIFSILIVCAGLVALASQPWMLKTLPQGSNANLPDDLSWRILALAAITACICWIAIFLPPDEPTDRLFLFLRTADLDSEVSPLVPILFAFAAGLVLIIGALRRRGILEARQTATPYLDFNEYSFSGVRDLEDRVLKCADIEPWCLRGWVPVVALILTWYVWFYGMTEFSQADTKPFDILFLVLSFGAVVGIVTAVVRAHSVWFATRGLLTRLYWHPSRTGYAKFHDALGFDDKGKIDLLASMPAQTAVEIGLAQVRELVNSPIDRIAGDPELRRRIELYQDCLKSALLDAEAALAKTYSARSGGDSKNEIAGKRKTEQCMQPISTLMTRIFEPLWRTETSPKGTPAIAAAARGSRPVNDLGEIYVASRVVDFLRQVMPQLETLAVTTTSRCC